MACPLLRAADLLLQERVPKAPPSVFYRAVGSEHLRTLSGEGQKRDARLHHSDTRSAESISCPTVAIMSSSAPRGGGYSRWRDLAVTRWREDATRDCWGTFVYLRDVATGDFWSTAYQPTLRATKGYQAIFTQARAEFRQRASGLDIHTEISVSPEDDVELGASPSPTARPWRASLN